MTAPVPEESNEALDLTEAPPGEHPSDMTAGAEETPAAEATQEENAESSLDQPSQ